MKYSLLLFDADDTLFDYEKAEQIALTLSFEFYNLDTPKKIYLPLYKEINLKIWSELEQKLITQDELKTERFRRLFEALSVNNIPADKFGKAYLKFLSEQTFLMPFAKELIKKLSTQFKLAIITNGLTSVQRPRFKASEIYSHFSEIIISEEFGISKPDPKIFDHALELCNHTDKSTVLMIGDNVNSDIQGGINAGIDTCWIDLKNKKQEINIRPSYIIDSIKEFPSVVGMDI